MFRVVNNIKLRLSHYHTGIITKVRMLQILLQLYLITSLHTFPGQRFCA